MRTHLAKYTRAGIRCHSLIIGLLWLCLGSLLLAGWDSTAQAQIIINSITPSAATNGPGTNVTFNINYTWPNLTQAATGAVINIFVPVPANTNTSAVSFLGNAQTTNTSYTLASQIIAFKFVSPLPAGSSGTLQFTVQVLNNGTVTNGSTATFAAIATATGMPPYTNTCTLTATSVLDNATLSKKILGSAATTNSLITYQISPLNTLPSLNITNWSMVDTLPTNMTYVSSSPTGIYNAALGTITWTSNSTPFNVGFKPTFTVQAIAPSSYYHTNNTLTNWVSTTNIFLDGNTVVVTTSNKVTLAGPYVNFGSISKTSSGWNGQFATPFTWSIAATSKGSDIANTFTIVDTNPPAFVPTVIGAGFGGDTPTVVYIQYQTKNHPTWMSLPGSPFSSTNNATATNYPVSSLSLGSDVVTMEQWTYTNATPLFAFASGGLPTVTGTITNVDIYGNPVSSTASITNYAALWVSHTNNVNAVTNWYLGTYSNIVVLSAPAPLVKLTKSVTGSPSQPGITNTWSLAVNNGATGSESLTNPVIVDLLPASLNYAGIFTSSGGNFTLTNTVVTTNYNGSGQTLVKISYTGYLVTNATVTAKFNTSVAAGVVPSNVTNTFSLIGWANAALNSVSPLEADISNLAGLGTNSLFPTTNGSLTVSAAAAASSYKQVKGQLNSSYVGYPLYGTCYPGGPFSWQLTVSNPGNVGLTNITVIDILPYVGDTGVQVTNQARGSSWQPTLTGPVSGPSGVTVYYSLSTNCYRPEIIPTGVAGWVNDWTTTLPADPTTVRSLKFAFNPTNVLAPLSSVQLTWSMQIPAAAATNSLCYNSFAYTATPAITNTSALISEPNKVGVLAAPLQPAFLGDYVWNDANTNGIQDAGETGINGVRVELYTAGPSGIPGGSDEVFQQFVLTANGPTGSAGYYQFPYLAASNYFVKVIPPANYAISAEYQGSNTNVYSAFNPTNGFTALIPLILGQTNEAVDCGLHYTAVGTIGDYVWIDRNGDGLQNEGSIDGLNGVTVQLYSETSTTTNLYGTTVTAFDSFRNPGYYHFYNLPPGQYQLKFVTPSGDTFTSFEGAGSANSGNESEAHTNGWTSPFTVAAGDNQVTWDAGVVLPTGPLSVGNIVWYDVNADSVYSFSGGEQGINNVIVSLYYDTDGNGVFTPGTDQLYSSTLTSTLTGEPGNYSFNNLPAGNYIVVLEAVNFQAGGALSGLTNDPVWLAATNYVDNYSKATWVSGYAATTAFPMAAGTEPTTPNSNLTEDFGLTSPTNLFSLGNTIFLDSNTNGYQDAGELGVTNLTIQLWRVGASGVVGGGDAVLLRTTNTDTSGHYLFSYLPPTNYFLEIPTPPTNAQTVSPVLYTGTNVVYNRGLQPGGYNTAVFSGNVNLTNTDLTQDFGFFSSTGLVAIGNVIFADANANGLDDAGDAGIPGVGVALASIVPGVSTNIVAYTTTSTNGMYLFDLQPPGTYSVVVLATNFQTGGPLVNYLSSPGAVATNQYTSLAADQYDHGLDNANPAVNGIHTASFFFGVGAAPTGANPASPAHVPATNANLTMDLGFYQPVTIGHYVWNDTNADGLQSAGEKGIAKVGLSLLGTNGSGTVVTDHTVTDNNGQYLFAELPGTYIVSVDATNFNAGAPLAGFLATLTNAGTGTNDSGGSPNGTIPTTMVSGQSDTNVNFGYYQPVTIGDYVWNDLNGDGIQNDGTGSGLAGVGMDLTGTNAAGVPVTDFTTTDVTGHYLFTELPGSYTVSVDPTNFSAGAPLAGFVPTATGLGTLGTGSMANPASTSLPAGGSNLTLDFGYYQPVTIGDFVWVDTNGNGVQEAGEPGVAGVGMTLIGTNGAGSAITNHVVTDSTGHYLFTAAPGTYVVSVDATNTSGPLAGYTATATGKGTTATDSNPNPSGTSPTALSSGSSDLKVDFGYYQAVTIGDFVWVDTNGNGVQDAGEPGIVGVGMTLIGTNNAGLALTNHVVTDGTGHYLFTTAPGTYVVSVDATNTSGPLAGYTATATGKGTTATDSNPNPSGTTPATLNSGGSDLTIDFGYYQAVTIGDFVWADTNGNGVQDAGELGIVGVGMTLIGTNSAGLALTNHVVTDGTGHYLFTAAPGTYIVSVDATNAAGPLAGLVASLTGQGTTATDSNPNPSKTSPSTLTSGLNDLTIDFGYSVPVTIGDYTWLDLNKNGIQDAGEPALGGVTVVLFQSNLVTHVATALATNLTSNSGGYLFTNLPAGVYQLQFLPPAGGYTYSPALQGSNTNVDSNANATNGYTSLLTYAPGAVDLTQDAGFEPNPTAVAEVAMRAQVVAGQVWVNWQTYTEDGLLAFDVTRTDAKGIVTDVTPDYVFASGQSVGADYSVLDAGATLSGKYAYNLYGYYNDLSVALLATTQIQLTASVVPGPIQNLTVQMTAGGLLLHWSGGQSSYVVEQSSSLGADAVWQPVGLPTTNTEMTLPLTGPAGFFRIQGN